MNNYRDYYIKTIESRSNLNGLKLVLGGTGLGKTYGLKDAIEEYVKNRSDKQIKFIYLTNRHNLISEQEKDLNSRGINTTYLKKNTEIVLSLQQETGLHNLVEELEKISFFQYDSQLSNDSLRRQKLNRLINSIDSKSTAITEYLEAEIKKTLSQDLESDCNELFNILKSQCVLIKRNNEKQYNSIVANHFIWKLFPYIEFENSPDCNVLLVTIHKVLHGVFNGKTDIKLASIEDKVIFLDEFDFVERDILKILCNEPSIINPLEFVTIFYRKFKHWGKASFWESNSELKRAKEKFYDVIDYIDESSQKHKLDLKNTLDFKLSQDSDKSIPNVLFQSDQLVTPKPFFLREENNSWIIEQSKPAESVNPRVLFNILAIATNKILGVFSYIKTNQPLVDELIQNIWNQKNDNQAGIYENYIKQNMLYHRSKVNKPGAKKSDSRSAYEIGYRLVKLSQRTNSFDPYSAELNQVELFTTPEALIAKIADNNIVFALSATTDIPRTLRSFNINWLINNSNFIPLDEEDYILIKKLRDEKSQVRQTKVNLEIGKLLDESSLIEKKLVELLKSGFFSNPDDKSKKSCEPRKDRISLTLSVIQKILEESDKFSHLIFLTTFSHLRDIISYKGASQESFASLGKEEFWAHPIEEGESNNSFQLRIKGKSCNIIFLNAEDAKKLETAEGDRKKYKGAFCGEKVIVVTQYQSASNGVNLPCFDKNGNETDFMGLHLLEGNHFWFDDTKNPVEYRNIEKQAFWYLWKLWDGNQIDKSKFKLYLNKQDNFNSYKPDISAFNKLYREEVDERILNAIALYHQAIGRIERKKMFTPIVDITLSEDIFSEFYRYLTNESFHEFIAERDSRITSSLILEIQEKVLEKAKILKIKSSFNKPKSIKSENDRSQSIIHRILGEIEKVKCDFYDTGTSKQIIDAWLQIREAILKHQFSFKLDIESLSDTIDIERDFCFETKAISLLKEVFIDPLTLKVHKENKFERLFAWRLDQAYEVVQNNTVIQRFFEKRNYANSFKINGLGYNTLFTPYIYQAILLGAIGEKSIEALLLNRGIELEEVTNLPYSLFEVIDGRVKGTPFYVDFKNFRNSTLDKFSFTRDSPFYDSELNSEVFLQKQLEKIKMLRSINPKAVLYIINLYSPELRLPTFLNERGRSVNEMQESCVRIIPSALNPKDQNQFSPYFNMFVKEIETNYERV